MDRSPVHGEGGHPGPARPVGAVAEPGAGIGGEEEALRGPRQLLPRGAEMAEGGQDLLAQAERRLHEGGEAPRRARVAHVGLRAAQGERGAVRGVPEEGGEGPRLGLVLPGVPAPVALDEAHAPRIDAGVGVGPGEGALERLRRGVRIGPAPGGRPGAAEHRVDAIPVPDRVLDTLEDDGRRALADHAPVGARVEGARSPRGGEGAHGVGAEGGAEVPGEVDRPHEGAIDLPAPQGAERGLHGAEPARLLALDGEGGAAEAELPREAARDHAPERPDGAVRGEGRMDRVPEPPRPGVGPAAGGPAARLGQEGPAEVEVRGVEVEAHPDEDPGGGIGVLGAGPGVLQGLRRGEEHEELLGQHLLQLPGRDPEAVEGDHRLPEVPAGEGRGPPPAGRGSGGLRGGAAEDALLEGAEGVPGAEPGGHPHDGHRLPGAGRKCIML